VLLLLQDPLLVLLLLEHPLLLLLLLLHHLRVGLLLLLRLDHLLLVHHLGSLQRLLLDVGISVADLLLLGCWD